MKITIINNDKAEKRYTREELEEFVAQLREGAFRQSDVRDFKKEVCFAAEWVPPPIAGDYFQRVKDC